MTELQFITQIIKWSIGLGSSVMFSAFGLIWWELRTLRGTRHRDMELIARVSLDNETLSKVVKDQMEDKDAQLEEYKRKVTMLEFMLEQAGKDIKLEYK